MSDQEERVQHGEPESGQAELQHVRGAVLEGGENIKYCILGEKVVTSRSSLKAAALGNRVVSSTLSLSFNQLSIMGAISIN